MYQTSQAFMNTQSSGIATVMAKIQILDQNENVLQEIVQEVEDGSIKIDKTGSDPGTTRQSTGVRRSFTLTLDNSEQLFQLGWPGGIWLNNRIKLFTGFQTGPSTTEYVPQGVFIVRQPKATSKPDESSITLQGDDKAALLNGTPGGTLADTWVISQGTNVATAVQIMAKQGGVTNFNFAPCSFTVPYPITSQTGDTLWKAICELAWSISWQAFFDRNGYMVFRPQPNYVSLPPMAVFSTENPSETTASDAYTEYDFVQPAQPVARVFVTPGQLTANPYMGTEFLIDDNDSNTNGANHIVVIGGSSQTATVQAEAVDSSPNSPTSTVTLGQDRVRIVRDPIITTTALAQARANYELQNSVIAAEKQTIKIVPNYLLDEEDVITLNDTTLGVNKNCVVIKATIPLKWDQEMTMEAWSARDILAENNITEVTGA